MNEVSDLLSQINRTVNVDFYDGFVADVQGLLIAMGEAAGISRNWFRGTPPWMLASSGCSPVVNGDALLATVDESSKFPTDYFACENKTRNSQA